MATVIIGPVLTEGSISRFMKIIGVREPTREARDTASIIPVPTTTPNRGSVFNKKFSNKFNEKPNEVSILAYDALGLIYYCWANNNFKFQKDQLYSNKGFKGLHGEFLIKDIQRLQKLKMYKITGKKFIKVY